MHILIVDDCPEFKVQHVIRYFESKKLDFSYEIVKSYHSASKYIAEHVNEIELAIVDLGLPMFDNGENYNELEGLVIVDRILRKKISIPIIINSTTEIPNEAEYFERYTNRNAIIKHVQFLDGKWLIDFISQL